MINFNLNQTAGVSQSKGFKELEGNKIHEVTFDGCEATETSTGKKVLNVKFSNNEGTFSHTIWEWAEGDNKRPTSSFGEMPSNIENLQLLIKHLIDMANPEFSKDIDEGKKSLVTSSWDAFRKSIVDITTQGIGKQTKIKLIIGNNGKVRFPYFSAIRDGVAKITSNFIGDNVYWLNKELDKINKAANAKPTTNIMDEDPVSRITISNLDAKPSSMQLPDIDNIDDMPF